MKKQLTSKQKQMLSKIKDILNKKGTPPTYKELMREFNYSNASSVQKHTDALKEKGYLEDQRGISLSTSAETVQIPLVGNAPCGQPLLAVENIEAYIAYPSEKIRGDYRDYFFLRGVGDSMDETRINGKNIDDGDYVLIRKQSTAEPGNRVVALIGDDATIKKYVPEQNSIKLMPESSNDSNKPIIVFEDILIQGIAVDVIKQGGTNSG